MTRKMKWYRMFAVLLTVAMFVTGCGAQGGSEKAAQSGETDKPAATEAGKEDAAVSEEKTIVTFQTWNPADTGEDCAIHQIISAFEQENPDIEINYVYVDPGSHHEQLKVRLIGGEGPDIYGMSTGANYQEFRDFEEELSSYCSSAWGDEWLSKFYDSCMSSLESDGNYYGIPLGVTYAGYAWADKNMLKEYGLDVPSSYEELLADSKVLRENGQLPLSIGAKDAWLNVDVWMSMANDLNSDKLYSAIEGKTPFTDPELVESFTIWQNCFTEGIFQDGAVGMTLYNDVNEQFQKEGSIPMILNGSWAMNMYTLGDTETHQVFNSDGADHEIFLIDWNNDGKVSPVTSATDVVLCMNKDSKVKEEAFRFMDYLVNEGQDLLVNKYLEYMPSRADMELNVEGLSEDGQEALQVVLDNAAGNVAGDRIIPYPELNNSIGDMLQALAVGQVNPQKAAEQIESVSGTTQR